MEDYHRICEAIGPGDYSLAHYFSGNHIIVRHDVDDKVNLAIEIADIEHSQGIRSTYYFRYRGDDSERNALLSIRSMGHEIGFHYETLAKAGGDKEWAVRLFKDQLAALREIADIKTVCPHGSRGYRNHKIMSEYLQRECALIGDAYLDVDFGNLDYYSDSGNQWHVYQKLSDHLDNPDKKLDRVAVELLDVIKAIESGDNVYIATHPQHWTQNVK